MQVEESKSSFTILEETVGKGLDTERGQIQSSRERGKYDDDKVVVTV